MSDWFRKELEKEVRIEILSGVSSIHALVKRHWKGDPIPHTLRCLSYQRRYALQREQWRESQTKSKKDEYKLPEWKEMTAISNKAFHLKLRRKAINEIIDTFGVVPVTFRSWSCSVRENIHGTFFDTGVFCDGFLYEVNFCGIWQRRKAILNDNWDNEPFDNFSTTIKRRTTQNKQTDATPVGCLLMQAIRNCFKSSQNTL
jgi:hypothetical protein